MEILKPGLVVTWSQKKNCDLANEENRSNEKNPVQQIADTNAEKHSQEKISASKTF